MYYSVLEDGSNKIRQWQDKVFYAFPNAKNLYTKKQVDLSVELES